MAPRCNGLEGSRHSRESYHGGLCWTYVKYVEDCVASLFVTSMIYFIHVTPFKNVF